MNGIVERAKSILTVAGARKAPHDSANNWAWATLRLSNDVATELNSLPDSPWHFVDNALRLWVENGCPWFLSSGRQRSVQKRVSYNTEPFKEMADKFTAHRLSVASFLEEVVYQYNHGATDGLKPVIDGLKSIYSDGEEKVTLSFNSSKSINQLAAAKALDEGLKKTRVVEALVRAWLEAGSPKLDIKSGGPPVIVLKIPFSKSISEKFDVACEEAGLSKRKVVDTLLLAWVAS